MADGVGMLATLGLDDDLDGVEILCALEAVFDIKVAEVRYDHHFERNKEAAAGS